MSNEFDIFAATEEGNLQVILDKGSYKWTNKFTIFASVILLVVGSASLGAWYQSKHSAGANATTNLASLRSSFRNGGGFGGGFGGGGFGGASGANSGANSGAGTSSNSASDSGGAAITVTSSSGSDIAGTVVSIDAKNIVIQTLDGSKKSFPITDSTKYRSSSKIDSKQIAAGDIVTVKPDDSNNAKTIMVVK